MEEVEKGKRRMKLVMKNGKREQQSYYRFALQHGRGPVVLDGGTDSCRMTGSPLLLLSYPVDAVTSHTWVMNRLFHFHGAGIISFTFLIYSIS